MGKKKDISVEKKSAIIALLKSGRHSLREIVRLQEVSHGSVAALKSKIREGQENVGSLRQNCGRKRKKNDRNDRRVISILCGHRRLPLREVKNMLQDEGIELSVRILKRRCAEVGLKFCRPKKKPRLTEAMRKKRLIFAKTFKDTTVEQWKKLIYRYFPFLKKYSTFVILPSM